MPLTPRLIEHWMPVNQVSTEAIRERAAASALPPLNWLHVWWARRPQALSRATTLLSLLPQSADAPETRQEVFGLLGTFEGIHKIAKRLADAKANGVKDKDGYKGLSTSVHPQPFARATDLVPETPPNRRSSGARRYGRRRIYTVRSQQIRLGHYRQRAQSSCRLVTPSHVRMATNLRLSLTQ